MHSGSEVHAADDQTTGQAGGGRGQEKRRVLQEVTPGGGKYPTFFRRLIVRVRIITTSIIQVAKHSTDREMNGR